MVSIGATRYVSPALEKGFFTSYSSFGLPDRSRKVDLAAPSADSTAPVVSINYGGGYTGGGGTSYACPTAVGAFALAASAGIVRSEILDAFKETAVVKPGDPVPNVDTGWGEIDVAAAVAAASAGIRGIEPEEGAEFQYETVRFKFRLIDIRTDSPAPVVTIERTDGGFTAVVPPANYTLLPDPANPRISWIEGEVRLVDGSGGAEGGWRIKVEGTEVLPEVTVYSDEQTVEVEYFVIAAGLNMITIPYSLAGSSSPPGGRKPESFFDPGFTMFRYVPAVDPMGNPIGSYAQYSAAGPNTQDAGFTPNSAEIIKRTQVGGTPIDTPQQGPWGVGWWLNSVSDSRMDLELGPEEGVKYYRIKLEPGWNQFGNPYEFFVDWNTAMIVEIPTLRILTIDEAVAAHILLAQVFRYELLLGGAKAYTWRSPPDGQLYPFESHWVFTFQECWLQLTPIPAQFRSRGPADPRVRGDGWLMQLTASSGEAQDPANYFGVTMDLNESFDLVADPPASPGGISLWFNREGEMPPLAQDLRALSSGRETWSFTVRPNQPNADVIIRWNDVVTPTRRMRMTLRDEATARVLTMRTNGTYTFRSSENMTPRTFTITVQPEAVGRLVIGAVRVAGNSRGGGGYSIQYSLNVAADVSIRILRTDGRLVADLESASRSAGSNAVVWDGRDERGVSVAPGVYMVQITAETAEGERARTTTPITVIR